MMTAKDRMHPSIITVRDIVSGEWRVGRAGRDKLKVDKARVWQEGKREETREEDRIGVDKG